MASKSHSNGTPAGYRRLGLRGKLRVLAEAGSAVGGNVSDAGAAGEAGTGDGGSAGGSPGPRVLFMSGYTHDVVVHHDVVEAGLSLLEKPFTPVALLKRVREVLEAPTRRPRRPG